MQSWLGLQADKIVLIQGGDELRNEKRVPIRFFVDNLREAVGMRKFDIS